jgi:polyribonucleotide nucleotidyltransferase
MSKYNITVHSIVKTSSSSFSGTFSLTDNEITVNGRTVSATVTGAVDSIVYNGVAIAKIRGITAEAEVGAIYIGKVVKTADFGAFVNFLPGKDGLVHISELANARVAKTTDIVKEGDQVRVKVVGFDDRGKVKLSMRVVDQATGADITAEVGEKRPREPGEDDGERRPPRRDRDDRRPRRDRD